MRRIATILAGFFICAFIISTSPPASADPSFEPTKYLSKTGMWVKGVDTDRAEAAGYEVKKYSDGRFPLVPKAGRSELVAGPIIDPSEDTKKTYRDAASPPRRSVQSAAAYPWDTEADTGNCGTNYNTVEQTAPHKVYVQSGFYLTHVPREVDWRIKLIDQNGSSYQSVINVYTSNANWSHTWYNLNQYVTSNVQNASGSQVITTDFYVCWPGPAGAYIRLI